MPGRRWDTDDRFAGIREAGGFADPVRQLLETAQSEGWVTEDPDAHLLRERQGSLED